MDEGLEITINQGVAGGKIQNLGIPGNADDPTSEATLEIPEARSIRALMLIEQYVSLRSEIEKRIEIRQQILALTLLVAGTFLTVGAQPGVSQVVLLFYPILAMFLGAIWTHNDLRIGQINQYIRMELEKYLSGLGPGWETYRRHTFLPRQRQNKGRDTKQEHPLTPPRGLILFSTRGMFLTTQLLTIVVAAVRYLFALLQQNFSLQTIGPQQWMINIVVLFLFGIDVSIIIYTGYLLQHKRG